jgi:hypothetical protein
VTVLLYSFYITFVNVFCTVPKKEPEEQPHRKEQQQSRASAGEKEFNKEHLEAVRRYYLDYTF